MGPPLYMGSVVDQNVDMRHVTVIGSKCIPALFHALKIQHSMTIINQGRFSNQPETGQALCYEDE